MRLKLLKTKLGLLALLAAMSLPAICQGAEPRHQVVVIETMPVPVVLEQSAAFRHALGASRTSDGRGVDIRRLEANGNRAKAAALLRQELKSGRPDLVVTFATLATQAAAEILKGTDIPLLFATVADPVGAGVIAEIGKVNGSNITGRVQTIDRRAKIDTLMRLLQANKPNGPIRLGILHSSYQSSLGDVRELQTLATGRTDLQFVTREISYRAMPEGLSAMLSDATRMIRELDPEIDYWWQPTGPMAETEDYTRLLLEQSKKPVIYGNTLASVKMGALMSITPDSEKTGRELAQLAEALLAGTKAGSIPVVPPAGYSLGLNLTTALRLGVIVPADLLELAGPHIYR